MKYEHTNDTLVLSLKGTIDSATTAAVEEEASATIRSHPAERIILDFSEVSYVSSAGLRTILRLKQTFGDVSIQNASLEVYDTFQMTGFTNMMKIRKKLHEVDLTGAEVIGEGFCAIVYRIDKDTIIKVFRLTDDIDDVERELNLAKQAFVLGIPTAISFDVVKCGDRLGVRFEMLDCASLRDVLRDQPEKYDLMIHKYAELLMTLNSTDSMNPSLPSAKDAWLRNAKAIEPYLEKEDHDKLVRLLESVPERNTFVHGDCHFKNIMVQNDELLLIDMDTLSRGHPIFEWAAIYSPYIAFEEDDPGNNVRFFGLSSEFTTKVYHDLLKIAFKKEDQAIYDKIALVAYCHMMRWNLDNTPDFKPRFEGCRKRLLDLLHRYDDLDIGI